ncbi:MAG: DNA mismatch repair protein MutS, partial [Veillonella caviae]|nr:DNA mismatch repair protein MutS [Veillonella caviae]
KLKNYTVAVKEKGKDVVFLRRIVRGGADRSYGIHVAKLAGLPSSVLKRAEVILESLESTALDEAAALEALTGVPSKGNLLADGEVATIDGATHSSAVGENSKATAGLQRGSMGANNYSGGNLFTNSVLEDLLAVDIMSLTPIEALNVLFKLQEEARKGGA